MDAYPSSYVEHNLPLVVLGGLGSRDLITRHTLEKSSEELLGGVRVAVDLPLIDTRQGGQLLQHFLDIDGRQAPWNGKGDSPHGRFRVKAVGRVGQQLQRE
jgi:hypothetical protein